MLKIILGVVAVAICGVLVAASTRPDTFHVERSATINAPADSIYPMVTDFHRWGAWSPYEKLDPTMKRTFSGAPSGVGAAYGWSGNSSAGEGRMEITEAVPPSLVHIKLDFSKPFPSHNIATFSFVPEGNATKVTWAMDGPSPFISKVMGVFMS
ncbi:MAG: SRPBCC family protein, partial [Gemmatimonadaceae bacterium]